MALAHDPRPRLLGRARLRCACGARARRVRAGDVMVYGSVCSGIESASVAWKPLGWRCAFMSEIDKFPRAVLAHRFPEVPLHGDFTTIAEGDYEPIDLLVGGTPCQDFSVAGKRAGLRGARGNLTLEYCLLAERLRPRWLVWENVPGVLSSNGGRDFGAFLGLLGECGYGFAWRVLDAQYVRVDGHPRAVPQRRERVFLVGYLGDWRPPAAALFEPEGMRGDSAPRREAGKGHPGAAGERPPIGRIVADVASTLDAHYGDKWGLEDQHVNGGCRLFVAEPVAFNSTGHGWWDDARGAAATLRAQDSISKADTLIAFSCKDSGGDASPEVAPTLRAMGHDGSHANAGGQLAVAFSVRGRDGGAQAEVEPGGVSPALRAAEGGSTRPMVAFDTNQITSKTNRSIPRGDRLHTMTASSTPPMLADGYTVRRLSVTECERLQGFPDGWTQVPYRGKPAADGPRYKALGNSKAVNVVRWVGMRIAMVDAILKRRTAA